MTKTLCGWMTCRHTPLHDTESISVSVVPEVVGSEAHDQEQERIRSVPVSAGVAFSGFVYILGVFPTSLHLREGRAVRCGACVWAEPPHAPCGPEQVRQCRSVVALTLALAVALALVVIPKICPDMSKGYCHCHCHRSAFVYKHCAKQLIFGHPPLAAPRIPLHTPKNSASARIKCAPGGKYCITCMPTS